MVSRVRIEGHGPSIEECKRSIREQWEKFAAGAGEWLEGTEVYERDLGEPHDSNCAYKGRLIVHKPLPASATPRSGTTSAPGGW